MQTEIYTHNTSVNIASYTLGDMYSVHSMLALTKNIRE